jgi:hypothetical protein
MAKQDKAPMFRPEALALAANVLAQAKGELSGARHLTGEAHGWLCSIDPTWREPAPVDAPVLDGGTWTSQQWRDEYAALQAEQAQVTAEWSQKAGNLQATIAEQARTIANLEADLKDKSDLIASLSRDLHAAKAGLPTVATVATIPAAVAAPAKAAPAVKSAPVAASGVDPFAHLPPAMAKWARAKAATSLDID